MDRIINKTMDAEDLKTPEASKVVDELNDVVKMVKSKKLKISSWYGQFDLTGNPRSPEWINRGYHYTPLGNAADDRNFPWFLYWEIVWVVLNDEFRPGQTVLDLGGSSSLFSYYLASEGLDVTTVDLQRKLVDNANTVAGEMGWNLKNYVMDMRELHFRMEFDHITSLCVYEHIPLYDRVRINEKLKDVLVDKGTFSITFDYLNPSRSARITSPEDVRAQFVAPSGLKVRGNEPFYDNGKRYLLHPFYSRGLWARKVVYLVRGHFSPREMFRVKEVNDYTFGALFLEKDEGQGASLLR